MLTKWGKALDREHPLPEYPRPQLQRDSYLNLNGIWEYAITGSDTIPQKMDGEIIVPFSPESELSGVGRTLHADEILWYRRCVSLPKGFLKSRLMLHFCAVDQDAEVYINGKLCIRHEGGYTPFSADVTTLWYPDEENEILVKVRDDTDKTWHSRGKQKTKRGGIWYTPQSGIWQTVWMESLPDCAVRDLLIRPDCGNARCEITVFSDHPAECGLKIGERSFTFRTGEAFFLPMPGFKYWSPEHPHLYDFEIKLGEDRIRSYFAMRSFETGKDADGHPRLFLNGHPYFHNGLLDQGYYSDGLLTPPSDEAMIHDIRTAKELGFNTLRKHIKIEPLRWYYHCDRLGMLVWQDFVNGGRSYDFLFVSAPVKISFPSPSDHHYRLFGRQDAEGREAWYRELRETVLLLRNVPSIAMWVPFNEAWGQFDAAEAARRAQALDPTRTIDTVSGWYDQGIGEFRSHHVYFKPYTFKADKAGRTVLLSEFGGYTCRIPGHCFSDSEFGYKRFNSKEELVQAFEKLYREEIIPAKGQGLAAAIYTQLTDVEDELNGMMTYDREILKYPPEKTRVLFSNLSL